MSNTTKKCSQCELALTLDHFNKNKAKADGLQNNCRDCDKAYRNARQDVGLWRDIAVVINVDEAKAVYGFGSSSDTFADIPTRIMFHQGEFSLDQAFKNALWANHKVHEEREKLSVITSILNQHDYDTAFLSYFAYTKEIKKLLVDAGIDVIVEYGIASTAPNNTTQKMIWLGKQKGETPSVVFKMQQDWTLTSKLVGDRVESEMRILGDFVVNPGSDCIALSFC